MERFFKRLFALIIIFACLIPLLPQDSHAQETGEARDITWDAIVSTSPITGSGELWDKNQDSYARIPGGGWLTLEHEAGIGSLYLILVDEYPGYTVTNNDTGAVETLGQNCFLHDFVDLEALFGAAPGSITLSFPDGDARIREFYAFTPGQTPGFVQKWELPVEGATDLVLFSTHGDDEQLFFAGLLPYYAGELGYRVQVCYLTDHRATEPERIHEMLNGLWAVGVTRYPVSGGFADFWTTSMEDAYLGFSNRGTTRDDLIDYVVTQLRRFRPLVVVGHDIDGEYGHGQHMAYTDVLLDSLLLASDPAYNPASAERYGVWDVPKTYLHLYWDGQITMDWDRPLARFGGMTAFEVTKDLGFPCHKSQQRDFAYYFRYTQKTADVKKYNPAYYGLYRSTVGEDTAKDDFFENLTHYAEQERLAEEARQAEEEARRRAEEEARQAEKEARRMAEEEARRKAQEEQDRREEEAARKAAEEAAVLRRKYRKILTALSWCALLLMLTALVSRPRRR